ncbi:MAG: sigma-54-dependent Fis family transcriptional regulator [Acidobacteria bacterium]|nr:sigma-54-dependent Fis family transcriptional regulator [Acidobacteriota bacterium]
MKHANILLVDDDKNLLRVLTYQIQELGFRASGVSAPREALQRLKEEKVDLVITDLKMPEMDGLQLLREVGKINPDLPVIVLTAHGTIDKAVEAIKEGAFDFLTKPFAKEQLRHVIANALKMTQLLQDNRRLSEAVRERFQFEGLIGGSKLFQEILDLAKQLSKVDTTVLIQGESGTGKEILARAIHFHSHRASKPFVVVNCGAIPEGLVESELFGHRRGSFTGAVSDQKGKFETADSGTLFLDEIGELPLNSQVKLLRVLQDGKVDVVGDPRPRQVDVRILAATNKDLRDLVRQGDFREDLYYRLSVAPLSLPPLRRRREDIPLLVHHFVEKIQAKLGKTATLDPSVLELLQGYDWPGNVRELENVVEHLIVFNRTGVVQRDELPAHIRHPMRPLGKVVLRLPDEGFSLEELERDLLYTALERHDWNQTHAASYLGITRNTLIYRMQKFNLRPEAASSKP